MAAQERKLFLLDAYALIYRAFFALNKNPRINSHGLNTSAIIGFLNTLYEVIRSQKPTHIGVAFDLGAPSERTSVDSSYKANRESMPDDLRAAVPYIIRLIKAFNIPIYAVEGYEADDVIGTLSKKAEQAGFKTFMMTPDKDFGQLVTENTMMFKPAKMGEPSTIVGPKEICEKYGISNPKQLIDILGLWGDAADNIPGIPGIGEKTASKLIADYGSMENIIAHADELKGKLKENVIRFAEQGLMSKMLATINTEVPVEFNEEELRVRQPDVKELTRLLEELEMKNFLKRFADDYQKNSAPPANRQMDMFATDESVKSDNELDLFSSLSNIQSVEHQYTVINNASELKPIIKTIETEKRFAFSTEMSGSSPHSSTVTGLSIATGSGRAWFMPLTGDTLREEVLGGLKPLFANPQIEKTGYNLKNSISLLRYYNIDVEGILFDIMIAHYLIEPEQKHNLDYIAETLLGYNMQSEADKSSDRSFANYSAEKADICFQLRNTLSSLMTEKNVVNLFNEVEMPLVPVLSDMESNGVKINTENLQQISTDFGKQIEDIENMIFALAGTRFNIGSPRQLGDVLFEKLKIDSSAKKTKTGQYATGEEILQKLVSRHPVVQLILDYRGLTKLKSTYLDALPMLVNQRDGLIHTTFNQAVTATGRLSSTNPNLQNIPVRTDNGREIRKAFVPRSDGYTLMAADYSQIELRIITHLSQDPHMMDAFNHGLDIHSATAARVFGVDINDVTKDQRRVAKMVNFGIIYGISTFGLSERLSIPREQAKTIIENYFKEYQGIKTYMSTSIAMAKEKGYAETMLGRRRYLRDINASNSVVRGFAERNAINAPIQGSSADMIKIAMINISRELKQRNMRSKMILQVHDELIFDAHLDEVDQLRTIVSECMVGALPLSIPVVVEINTGNNWLEAH